MKRTARYIYLLALSTFVSFVGIQPSTAQWIRSKRSLQKEQQEKSKPKDKYKSIVEDKQVRSAKGAFCNLFATSEDKLYMELPIEQMGRDLLVAATVSSSSNPQLSLVGFKRSNPLHIRFVQKDSTVVMEVVNRTFFYNETRQPHLKASEHLNFKNVTLNGYKIHSYSPDSTSVLIDFTDFVLKDNPYFPIMETRVGAHRVSAKEIPGLSRIVSVKSFDENAGIAIERSFDVDLTSSSGQKGLSDYPTTVGAVFSFLALPKEPMIPRISDTRVGVFQNKKVISNPETGIIAPVTFVNKWRIEPSDSAAYFAGHPTTVRKPIVFYIDSAFPQSWREPIRKGILRWNKSFEKIGLIDVVQVRDFPTNDPEFDPDNLKYSCLRYVPIAIENAMGPSWIDPRTGEIINASVFVYSDVVELIRNWRFVQTAQIDKRVRTKELDPEVFASSLEYVVAHEIGHTLGFMHNMAGSSSIPVDSLRSVSFTQKYGTTNTIMDYARYNYVAQPGDEGVRLEPPFLGVYDDFLIEWTYKPFPYNGDYVRESEALQALVAKHEKDPRYRHGVQQFDVRLDPSAIEEDLGDDPVLAADYGFKNLDYIMKNLNSWITDDENSTRKSTVYREVLNQAFQYIGAVQMNVSGIYLSQTSESSGLPRTVVVPKEKQRQSALWLLRKSGDFASLAYPEIEDKLYSAGGRTYTMAENYVRAMSVSSATRLCLTHYLDPSSYSPMEYLEDVYQYVFGKTIAGTGSLTEGERAHQRIFVQSLLTVAEELTSSNMAPALKSEGSPWGMPELPKELSFRKHQCHSLSCQDDHHEDPFRQIVFGGFGTEYGEAETLWMKSIDNSARYRLLYAEKCRNLLQKVSKGSLSSDLKLHYQYLLKMLEDKLPHN